MKIAGVVENSRHCVYSIGLNCFSLFYLVIYLLHAIGGICVYIYIYIYDVYSHSYGKKVKYF